MCSSEKHCSWVCSGLFLWKSLQFSNTLMADSTFLDSTPDQTPRAAPCSSLAAAHRLRVALHPLTWTQPPPDDSVKPRNEKKNNPGSVCGTVGLPVGPQSHTSPGSPIWSGDKGGDETWARQPPFCCHGDSGCFQSLGERQREKEIKKKKNRERLRGPMARGSAH